MLAAATRAPLTIEPDAPLRKAMSLMMMHEYSQLPVVSGKSTLKGLISWKSIGRAISLGAEPGFVRECMDREPPTLRASDRLLDAMPSIIRHECVIVTDDAGRLQAVVTTTDLSELSHSMAEKFLLLEHIERQLKLFCENGWGPEIVPRLRAPGESARKVASVHDLTLGELQRACENPDLWALLGVSIDRVVFRDEFKLVVEIRNRAMHFNPSGLDLQDIQRLRQFERFVARLVDPGATPSGTSPRPS